MVEPKNHFNIYIKIKFGLNLKRGKLFQFNKKLGLKWIKITNIGIKLNRRQLIQTLTGTDTNHDTW